jgi:hypothetical protein
VGSLRCNCTNFSETPKSETIKIFDMLRVKYVDTGQEEVCDEYSLYTCSSPTDIRLTLIIRKNEWNLPSDYAVGFAICQQAIVELLQIPAFNFETNRSLFLSDSRGEDERIFYVFDFEIEGMVPLGSEDQVCTISVKSTGQHVHF